MEKINVAELLKDCPSGMKLDCTMCDEFVLVGVDNSLMFPIKVKCKDGCLFALTKYGQCCDSDYAKCVIFPKGKTTWEGFVPPCQFNDGDIVATDSGRWLGIIKNKYDFEYYTVHCAIDYTFNDIFYRCGEYRFSRLATEEEKATLFKAIKDNGYKWNEETKTLKKLPKFKVGDKVKVKETEKDVTIEGMSWRNGCEVIYDTCYKNDCVAFYSAEELQPYKEETMTEASKAVFDANAQCCDIMNNLIKEGTMEEITMSTDELLQKLPNIIGNHRFNDCYIIESPTDQIGHLCLIKDKNCWIASYMDVEQCYVCLNPDDKQPPYNNAVAYGDTANGALQKLYDWCVKNGFIK